MTTEAAKERLRFSISAYRRGTPLSSHDVSHCLIENIGILLASHDVIEAQLTATAKHYKTAPHEGCECHVCALEVCADTLREQLAEARAANDKYRDNCGICGEKPHHPKCRIVELEAERDRLQVERLEWQKRERELMVELMQTHGEAGDVIVEADDLKQQLAALSTPSPCGVEGHTMATWVAHMPQCSYWPPYNKECDQQCVVRCTICTAYAKGQEKMREAAALACIERGKMWRRGMFPVTIRTEECTGCAEAIRALPVTGLADGK